MRALKMLVIGFGRRKVKRGVAHTAPVKELAARSIVNKLSAKKIAADTYRSLREEWYAAIFTRGLCQSFGCTSFVLVVIGFQHIFFFLPVFLFWKKQGLQLSLSRFIINNKYKKSRPD